VNYGGSLYLFGGYTTYPKFPAPDDVHDSFFNINLTGISCPEGTYSQDGGCFFCLPGTFSDQPDLTACTPCPKGTYQKYNVCFFFFFLGMVG
jgi:hypothetical protein